MSRVLRETGGVPFTKVVTTACTRAVAGLWAGAWVIVADGGRRSAVEDRQDAGPAWVPGELGAAMRLSRASLAMT